MPKLMPLLPFRKVLISLVNYCLLEIISQIAQLLFCFSNREIKIQFFFLFLHKKCFYNVIIWSWLFFPSFQAYDKMFHW